ncbi:MAG: pitrilysin family protein [Microcoleaceae cyanobacterium MO_207.B10]|nr:pitrilysin family protein [Microcoleaceae cyanobacterium MO_207.B10]
MPQIAQSTDNLQRKAIPLGGVDLTLNLLSQIVLFVNWCKKLISSSLNKAKLRRGINITEKAPERPDQGEMDIQINSHYPQKCNLLKKQFLKRTFWESRNLCLCLTLCVLWFGFTPSIALAREFPPEHTVSIKPYLDRVIKKVTEFRLKNDMKFIVLERDNAPVISFVIYADVGGANEPDGQTGVAHYLEHLAFKGTKKIGTKDYEAEKQVLDKLDKIFAQIQQASADGKQEQVSQLLAEFEETQEEASQYVNQNELSKIVERAGGVGINAATSADDTTYFYSLPANKLELWMSLESERFLEPVFREFYKEKQVILEERRLRTDNSPVAQMLEEYLSKAFQVHPYRRPIIGYPEDIRNLTRENVQNFFETHYVPSNLTVAIVGDVNPKEVKKLAETYFGRYEVKQKPPKLNIVEPPQRETREVTMKLESQPWYLEGYHRPAVSHPDNAVYEMLTSILSDGRTSRLYQSLVQEQQIALVAKGFNGYPGNKYPNLILFYAMIAPDSNVEEVAAALQSQIERLKTEPVSPAELERVKTQARAGLLRSLDSNMGMAFALLNYEVKTGSWQNLFKQLDMINAVTVEDIQRVAKETFVPENLTIGRLLPQS